MAFTTKRDFGNCARCHAMLKAGQAIERCKVTAARGRNIYGYKHAYAKDCPYLRKNGGDR